MAKIRVYVDTSVFGGVYDEEFAEPTQSFFDRVRAGEFTILVSRQVTEELDPAPDTVRSVLTSLPVELLEEIRIDDEVRALAQAYVDVGVLGPNAEGDAVHVAAATVGRADVLLSWNFKHLVRYENIRKFNGVNAIAGYSGIDIRSPLELGHVHDEEEDI